MRRTAAAIAGVFVLGAACDSPRTAVSRTSPPAAPSTTTTPSATPANAETALSTASTAQDAAALAAVITEAESAVRDLATPAADLATWGHAQQLAYRRVAARPEWDAEVVARLPEHLRPVAEANVRATRELWALTAPRPELPDWRIVEAPPAEELLAHYRGAEAEFGVPWEFLAAIHLVETRMGRIRGTSPAGARGPMQFLPSTWEPYGEGDIEDPRDSIRAAARYLAANSAPADMSGALFAYNRSDHYVAAITAYAGVMAPDDVGERAYHGYYHWQVYYRLTSGDVLLPVGYGS